MDTKNVHAMQNPLPGKSKSSIHLLNQQEATLRLFGVTREGNSVLAHVHGFQPYFFVAPWPSYTSKDIPEFRSILETRLRQAKPLRGVTRYIVDIQQISALNIWGYRGDKKQSFLKVTVALPSIVNAARTMLEQGISLPGIKQGHFVMHANTPIATFESDVSYLLRFLVDKNARGGGWVVVPANTFTMRVGAQCISKCQLEIDVWDYDDLHVPDCDGKWSDMAPMRIFSFDIECMGRKGVFPVPEQDPVIQIATLVTEYGKPPGEYVDKVIFALDKCADIHGARVLSFETEQELLMAWKYYLDQVDPDFLTGYNIINFDLPYLLDRAAALRLAKFPFLGRLHHGRSDMKVSRFSSKAYGTRDNKTICIEGRVQFDVLPILRREHKLRSYTLNAVSGHFIGKQKEDVHHSIISDLQRESPETRRRLAVYCLKDAELPLLLIDKLLLLVNYVEMARVTGVPISFLITRGQQIKVMSQLLRKARERNYLIPTRMRDKERPNEMYEGATVIDPVRGYYQDPIATLDFASLYPSIMQAHNLCYTTLLATSGDWRATSNVSLAGSDVTRTPYGATFVKSSVRKGILPEILGELLRARKEAKKLMAKATDPLKRAVFNGRQLALKVSANSVYGFTGAQVGQLPCLAISSSVTSFGREMIEHTKQVVQREYCVANGHEHDSMVVYGGTFDATFSAFGCRVVCGWSCTRRVNSEYY